MSTSMAPSSDLSGAQNQHTTNLGPSHQVVRDANGNVTSTYQETVYSGPTTTTTHEVTKQYTSGGIQHGSSSGGVQYGSTSAGQSQYTAPTHYTGAGHYSSTGQYTGGATSLGGTHYGGVTQYQAETSYPSAVVNYADSQLSGAFTSTGQSIAGQDYANQYHSAGQHALSAGYQSGAQSGYQSAAQSGYAGQMTSTGAQLVPALVDAAQQQYGYRTTTTTGGYAAQSQSGARMISGATETSRVVRTEIGQERVIAVHERVDESRTTIINERYIEHEVKVPKKIVREEVIEKTIIVPEVIRNEEYIEEMAKIREKIVEVAHPVIREKIIEIPEIEYVERTIEKPQKVQQYKYKDVDVVRKEDRIVEKTVIVPREKVVQIPDIQYRDVPVERIVEVEDWRDEYRTSFKYVDQYVDKPVPVYVDVEVPIDVERHLPVAVEANVVYEYRLPRIKPRYTKLTYPVHLPRFIEVPVAIELLNSGLVAQAESYLAQVGYLTKNAASLCEIEGLALSIKQSDLLSSLNTVDLQAAIMKAWQSGSLQATNASSSSHMMGGITTTTKTTTATALSVK